VRSSSPVLFKNEGDTTLQLSSAVLLAGKSCRLLVRQISTGTTYSLAHLDVKRPNARVPVEFDDSVEFCAVGDAATEVNVVGYLHSCADPHCQRMHCATSCAPSCDSRIKSAPKCCESALTETTASKSDELFALSDGLRHVKPFGAQLRENPHAGGDNGSTPPTGPPTQQQVTKGNNLPSGIVPAKEGNVISDMAEESAKSRKRKAAAQAPLVGVKRQLTGGVKYEIVTSGNGPIAVNGQKVLVKYEGRLSKTGTKFDSGRLEFNLGTGEMIPGFDIGVKGMLQNEERQVFIPARMGYGSKRTGAIPPNSDLVFTIKLINANVIKKR